MPATYHHDHDGICERYDGKEDEEKKIIIDDEGRMMRLITMMTAMRSFITIMTAMMTMRMMRMITMMTIMTIMTINHLELSDK